MLCKELMVGDWCCDKHGFPMQITNVGDDYAYATFEGNEGDPWEYDNKDDQPQPIEITRELLKANGWRAESLMASPWNGFVLTYYFVKDEGCIHLEFNATLLQYGLITKRVMAEHWQIFLFPSNMCINFSRYCGLQG